MKVTVGVEIFSQLTESERDKIVWAMEHFRGAQISVGVLPFLPYHEVILALMTYDSPSSLAGKLIILNKKILDLEWVNDRRNIRD